jgi:hypothetical protein
VLLWGARGCVIVGNAMKPGTFAAGTSVKPVVQQVHMKAAWWTCWVDSCFAPAARLEEQQQLETASEPGYVM